LAIRPGLVNGVAGVVVARQGRPFTVMSFTVTDGRSSPPRLSDPDRLRELNWTGGQMTVVVTGVVGAVSTLFEISERPVRC
jgi:hypothetical protein